MMPTRSCVVCRSRQYKTDLLRIVSLEGHMVLDQTQKINTRGIYLCNNKICLGKLKKLLEKGKITFKIPIEKESLKQVIENVEKELGE